MDLDDHWATVIDWRDNRTDELPDWAIPIIFILEAIMDEQTQENADVAEIGAAFDTEVAAMKAAQAAGQAVDFSNLDALAARVKAATAPAPSPAAAPPAPAQQQPAGTPAQPAQAPAATPAQPGAAATTPVATDVNGAPAQPPAPGEAPAPVHQAPAVNGGIGGATTPPSQSAPPQVPSAPPATQ